MSNHVDFQHRFPDLRPLNGTPTLFSMNGFGLMFYGRRDQEQEYYSYVTTHCLTALFFPILAVGAYRVVNDGHGGYVVLGREPLSGLAKAWNCLLLAAILTGGATWGFNAYTNSPEYLAGTKLKRARQVATDGELSSAARLYRDVINSGTSHSPTARSELLGMFQELDGSAGLARIVEAYPVAISICQRDSGFSRSLDPLGQVRRLATEPTDEEATSALKLVDLVAKIDPDDTLADVKLALLEQIVAATPKDVGAATRLAAIYDNAGETDRCEPILTPIADQLGSTEAARILGQIYVRQGKLDEGHPLLLEYCEQRLKELKVAEQNFQQAIEGAQRTMLNELNRGFGDQAFYNRYNAADEEEKRQIVQDYLGTRLKDHEGVQRAREELVEKAKIVPVALDLGTVILRRAQKEPDAKRREAELKQAEKVFLAIRGFAGDDDQFRLGMGQVYYWLGKHVEGRELFDALLEEHNRDFQMLLGVAGMLRQVGADEDCRKLCEEAYEATEDEEQQRQAALLRCLVYKDLEDSIKWLERCHPENGQVQASLLENRARLALRDGDFETAEKGFRAAIEIYSNLPDTSASLNNCGLVYFGLYGVTGDLKDLEQGREMIEKAVALKPDSSILLVNAATAIEEASIRDVIGDRIDLKRLRLSGDTDLLGYLYDDQPGHDQLAKQLAEHAGIQTALRYWDQALVLAPQSDRIYSSYGKLLYATQDVSGMQKLVRRLHEAKPGAGAKAADADPDAPADGGEKDEHAKENEKNSEDENAQEEQDAKLKQAIELGSKSQQEVMAETAESDPGTFAVSACYWVRFELMRTTIGGKADLDAAVTTADQAFQKHPSDATRSMLVAARIFRVSGRMMKEHPPYAEFVEKYYRHLGHSQMLMAAMEIDEPLRAKVVADDDFQRSADVLDQSAKQLPTGVGAWDWIVLHLGGRDVSQVETLIRADQTREWSRAVAQVLTPSDPNAAFSSAWAACAMGRPERAREILELCRKTGGVFPEGMIQIPEGTIQSD